MGWALDRPLLLLGPHDPLRACVAPAWMAVPLLARLDARQLPWVWRMEEGSHWTASASAGLSAWRPSLAPPQPLLTPSHPLNPLSNPLPNPL